MIRTLKTICIYFQALVIKIENFLFTKQLHILHLGSETTSMLKIKEN